MVEAYCVKCKTKRTIVNPKEVVGKNDRVRMVGVCPKCGINVSVFVASKKK